MAIFGYRCPQCGEVGEATHPMGATVFVRCPCGGSAERHYAPEYLFQHTEDRRHMRQGKSHATGEPYAQSRREERVIAKEKGIEFVGKSEMPSQWKTLAEHHRYVKQGGTPLAPEVLNPSTTAVEPGTIMRKVREKGIRFGA